MSFETGRTPSKLDRLLRPGSVALVGAVMIVSAGFAEAGDEAAPISDALMLARAGATAKA